MHTHHSLPLVWFALGAICRPVPSTAADGGATGFVPPPKAETNYAFRARMAQPRAWRSAGFRGAPVAADETVLDDDWTFAVESDSPVVRHAAADLKDFLEKRCRARCAGRDGSRRIVVAVAPEKKPLTSRITATETEIRVTGATPREAAQGCYRLEDELTARDQPAVKRGSRTYTRLYSPRMTHSGYEIEKFPDWHLDEIARAGMDAILLFISDPPDVTRNGREDVNALVERAALHGLDVYAYASFPKKAARLHPLDPGARSWYEATYGAIARNAPGLKGLICVGESVAFPSRDPQTAGYWWDRRPDAPRTNGFWPSTDWPDWLRLVTDVTRRHAPDFDVVFWTYNWFWTPEKDRLALLERIPTNISLHVTYEMGDVPERKLGAATWIDDYSITRPGPGTTFRSEAAVARRRGIRLTSMTNTGGRTWDFGAIPFVPSPYSWIERFRALKTSREDFGLTGLMDSHHYGFTPSFISELAKCAFTEETSADDLERKLEEIAARDFGRANTGAVLAAWRDWAGAMKWHSARSFDQYGALRIGPAYPFALPGEPIPPPPRRAENLAANEQVSGWKYVESVFRMPNELIGPYVEMAHREHALWRAGADKLEAALPAVPPESRDAARRMLGIGRFCEHTVRTALNLKLFYREAKRAKPDRAALMAILDDEERNVRETLPFVAFDSQLGWEPSMRYVADPESLNHKLVELDKLRARIGAKTAD